MRLWCAIKKNFCKPVRVSLAVLCLIMLAAQLQAQVVPGGDSEGVARTTYRVGGDHEYPPAEFVRDGIPDGFDVDLIRSVARATNINISIELAPWAEVRQGLASGQYDIVIGMVPSPERQQMYDFSLPYNRMSMDLFSAEDSDIATIDDLAGRSVLVQRGGIMHDYLLERDLNLKVIPCTDTMDIIQALAEKRAPAALMNRYQGMYFLRAQGIKGYSYQGLELFQKDYCFAVRKGDTRLVYLLNEGLNIVRASGEYDQLYEKWFGVYRPASETFAKQYLLPLIIGVMALLLLALLWIITLRREVGRKTKALAEELRHKTMIEGQLAAGAERLVAIISSIREGVIIADSDGLVGMINTAGALELDVAAGTAGGRQVADILPLRGFEKEQHPVRQVLVSAKALTLPRAFLESPSGKSLQVFLSVAPVCDNNGIVQGVVVVFRDIAPLLQVEEQLQLNRKLESMSLLAGGIAHDFNNIMTGIGGNISLAMQVIEQGSEASGLLCEASQAVEQARTLTRQLQAFARGGTPVRANVDTRELVEETVNFHLRGSAISVTMRFDEKLRTIDADRGQISQALQNLVLNAAQAMEQQGELVIEARNIDIATDNNWLLPAGQYVRIVIQDSGPGIPEEVLSRIFDPYFTTKKSGTGLGLSIVYSILGRHGGTITAGNATEGGARFEIIIPAGSDDVVAAEETVAQANIPAREAAVLVMDDEEFIREILQRMLQMMGFRVYTAAHGEEALRVVKEHGPLLLFGILDLTIKGGMGGRKAAEEIHRLVPGFRLIVTTGYCDDPVVADYQSFGFRAYLPKPFDLPALKTVISEVTGRSAS